MAKGGHIFASLELLESNNPTPTKQEILREEEKSKAILLLKNADDKRFGNLMKNLKDGSYLSRDEYPTTVASMYELMTKHLGILGNQQQKRTNKMSQERDKNSASAIFVQQKGSSVRENGLVPSTDGNKYDNVQCYLCRQWGQYKSHCPNAPN